MLEEDGVLLEKIITGDELWVYLYDLETKQKSQEWVSLLDKHPSKALGSHSQKKTMLVAFFDNAGLIHNEFVNRKVNRFVYCRMFADLREAVRKHQPTMWAPNEDQAHSLYLHHNNAPAHTAAMTVIRLMETQVDCLPHLPYSPDMAPSDYFLFP